ncbi:Aspartate aminotransferase [Methylophaga frappieri]|uniref:Aminotransferase n=2 Tax=Methylophaga frappieri (strain ATCC BAA-2434 / DSM 25690 / JAM7) TaxID=754477 RepID=I1YE90_METFJ|nr:Aspartate aminotransferase [Methylophaga frappieri]
MDILARSKAMEAQGKTVMHMEIGEPDFSTPQPIIEAGMRALQNQQTFYTPALGLPALREAISGWYQTYYGLSISANRIVVTPGASGALLLVLGALLDQNKKVLMTDPGYPCNRHFATFLSSKAKPVPVDAKTNFQLTARHIADYWDSETQVALVASPANPTGTVLLETDLKNLVTAVRARAGMLVVDEIYHGLTYDGIRLPTVLAVDNDAIVINSFSKFFGMTGWRLGWAVVPADMEPVMDRLAQNLFLAAPTISQHAALAAFTDETMEILEQRRAQFEQRRNWLLPALRELGFHFPVTPKGAFYLYADCRELLTSTCPDSQSLCRLFLDSAGVAVTPGYDFGQHQQQNHVRFAYTTSERYLTQAIERLSKVLGKPA